MLITKPYPKVLSLIIVMGLYITFSLNHLQASSSPLSDENRLLPSLPQNTALKDLRESNDILKGTIYQPKDFPYDYDELTEIGSTPCYEGKKNVQSFSVRHEQIPISAIMAEDGKAKIVDPSHLSHEQKTLIKNVDRRTQIKWPQTKEWPYRVHGHLIMKFPGETFVGTGFLIGPRHVLTAGHNLYNPAKERKEWANEVLFAPGRHEDHYPFGDYKGCLLLTHKKWFEKGREEYDIGMIILDSAIGEQIGWLGLLSLPEDLLKEWPVTITGYPGDKGAGDDCSTQMWQMRNAIKNLMAGHLFYDIDTWQGQSGSAAWGEYPGYNGHYTVGVHTYKQREKTEEGNRGTPLSKEMFDLILEWLKTYQVKEDYSNPLSLQQASIVSSPVIFSDELRNNYKSWVERAEKGEVEALYQIGSLYAKGEVIQKDDNKAYECFYHAAKEGYAPALTALGMWNEKKNLLKAISFYRQAADKKNAEAMRRLGNLYVEGKGLLQKVETGINLLKNASDQGDKEACYQLACIYDEGPNIKKDKVSAAQFYQNAKELGHTCSIISEPEDSHTKKIKFLTQQALNKGGHKLKLINKSITNGDLKSIKQVLGDSKDITELDLSHNNLNGKEAIELMGQILKQNPLITNLKLDKNDFRNSAESFLTSFQNVSLTSLSLKESKLEDNDCFGIIALLDKIRSLTKVNLEGNNAITRQGLSTLKAKIQEGKVLFKYYADSK